VLFLPTTEQQSSVGDLKVDAQGLNRLLDVSPLEQAPRGSVVAVTGQDSGTRTAETVVRAAPPAAPVQASVTQEVIQAEQVPFPRPVATQPIPASTSMPKPAEAAVAFTVAPQEPTEFAPALWWKMFKNVCPVIGTGLLWDFLDRRRRRHQERRTPIEMQVTRAC
jgi:hypothetical protein